MKKSYKMASCKHLRKEMILGVEELAVPLHSSFYFGGLEKWKR